MMSDRLSIKTNPILTAKHLASLHSAGVYTGSDLVLVDLYSLANRCTLSINELSILKRCVVEAVADPVTGSSLWKQLFSAAILKSGVPELDRLLAGGLYTGELVEVCGASLAGKSRLCLRVAAETARTGKDVLYLETSAGLASNASLIAEILSPPTHSQNVSTPERDSEDDEEFRVSAMEHVLGRVNFLHVFDCFSLIKTLARIRSFLRKKQEASRPVSGTKKKKNISNNNLNTSNENKKNEDDFLPSQFQLSLIVIDSLASIMSPLLGGRELTQGLSYLASIGRELKLMARDFNAVVLITNHLVSPQEQDGGGGVVAGRSSTDTTSGDDGIDRDRPAMGLSWSSVPDVRIKLVNRKTCESAVETRPRKWRRRDKPSESESGSQSLLKVFAILLKHSRIPCGKTKLLEF